jgi:hypothetical protein
MYVKDQKEKIDSIIFTGMLTIKKEHQSRTYSMVDRVWLMMKSIFEAQTFLISESGFIMKE